MKALVCYVPDEPVSLVQAEGLRIYRRPIARQLGLTFDHQPHRSLAQLRQQLLHTSADLAIVMVSWKHPAQNVIDLFRDVRDQTAHRLRLVFLDYYAPTASPLFGLAPYVDCYAKRQILQDCNLYHHQNYKGGYIFSDYFANRFNFDLGLWHFGSPLPPDHQHKLTHAWNLGVKQRYIQLLRLSRLAPKPWRHRDYDLHGRIGSAHKTASPHQWYHAHRLHSAQCLQRNTHRYRITPAKRIRRTHYLLEMRNSRLAFSPFGWGELCYRDYEIVACGALLLKPSMEHLTTSPDIFRPHETYVPLAWDLSDFEDKVDHYLAHPDQAQAIARNAQETLWRYYRRRGLLHDLARILNLAEANATPTPASPDPALVSN